MRSELRISIIINNYNYGGFLKQAIDSALSQTLPAHEIIVVDDGSTDNSLSVLQEYNGERIRVIAKANGGQASAFNAGFRASTGNWIWFLDADDWLDADAIKKMSIHAQDGIAKIHATLRAADEQGVELGYLVPYNPLSSGKVIGEMEAHGGYNWPPTSGNVFARWALERCMPMPEEDYRLCADLYICNYAAVQGEVIALTGPVGFYRIHTKNSFYGFQLNPVWLKNQASNILKAASLTEELVRKFSANKTFQFPYSRRNVEMLMIADRFSDLKPVGVLPRSMLHKNWWRSKDVQLSTGRKRYTAIAFWLILSFAPAVLTKYVINRGQRKAAKELQKNK